MIYHISRKWFKTTSGDVIGKYHKDDTKLFNLCRKSKYCFDHQCSLDCQEATTWYGKYLAHSLGPVLSTLAFCDTDWRLKRHFPLWAGMKLHGYLRSQCSIIKTGHVFVFAVYTKMSVCVRSCSVISGKVRVCVLFAFMFLFGIDYFTLLMS